jgi:hypothetical protein
MTPTAYSLLLSGAMVLLAVALLLFFAAWSGICNPSKPPVSRCFSYELQREQPASWLVRSVECP